jgi:hypothetical protein
MPVAKTAPQYKADDGPLSETQLRQIKKHAPKGNKLSLRSSLLDQKRTEK